MFNVKTVIFCSIRIEGNKSINIISFRGKINVNIVFLDIGTKQ